MKKKSLGELLSDALDKANGFYHTEWTTMMQSRRTTLQRAAKLFLASLPEGFHETTSPKIASKAGKALRSKRTGKAAKSIAASALTQARGKRKAKS